MISTKLKQKQQNQPPHYNRPKCLLLKASPYLSTGTSLNFLSFSLATILPPKPQNHDCVQDANNVMLTTASVFFSDSLESHHICFDPKCNISWFQHQMEFLYCCLFCSKCAYIYAEIFWSDQYNRLYVQTDKMNKIKATNDLLVDM